MKNKKMQSRGNEVLDTYKIDITPDKSLYQKMGEGGHNFYECNAEFIDNSIDAMTPKQKDGKEQLRIDIVINAKKKFYSITDNGVGMDKKTAMLAATLGKSLKTQKDLGSFGFGLKSGAMSIGDNFIIKTGMEENDYMTEVHYNHSEWTSNPNWTLPAKDLKKEIGEHGTSIIINKVTNIELNPRKTQYLKADIAKRYSSFIRKGTVKITVNGVIVTVEDIKWADGYPINFSIPTKYGEITGKIGLMVESSQKGYYGFDMFRNGRMIVTNSKFAIGQHPTTARIAGEINLDFVKVSHQKNKFIVDSSEYESAEQACKESDVFKTILREAKKKSEEGDNKKENVVIDKFIEGNMPLIAQAVKDLEDTVLFNGAASRGKAIVKTKKGLLDFIKDFNPKKRKQYEKRDEPTEKKKREHVPQKGDLIEINNQTFHIKTEYIFDSNAGRKQKSFVDGVLTITINKAYAGFKATKDKNAYCLETVQDAIVEFIFKDDVVVIEKINECKESLVSLTQKYFEHFKDSVEFDFDNDSVAEEENVELLKE